LFNYPLPQRWSITHLLHAILNGEEHVEKLDYLTTLSGYIHLKVTGRKVIGIGDASGMFPIDKTTKYFNKRMMGQFNKLVGMNGFPITTQ